MNLQIGIATALGAIAVVTAQVMPSQLSKIAPTIDEPAHFEPTHATARTRAILTDLIPCESGGDPEALNPLDLDGTPSHGILQFKPTTLYQFAREFDILTDIEPDEIYNVLYDPDIQIATATKMIEKYGDNIAFWKQQWPDCSKKYGYWQNY